MHEQQASQINGTATRTFPDRGYVWVDGEDGTSYFAHASYFLDGVDIFNVWVGRKCTFTAHVGDGPGEKGPFATEVNWARA